MKKQKNKKINKNYEFNVTTTEKNIINNISSKKKKLWNNKKQMKIIKKLRVAFLKSKKSMD